METSYYTCFRRSVAQLGRPRRAAWAPEKAADYSRDGEISYGTGTPAKVDSYDKSGGQRRAEAEVTRFQGVQRAFEMVERPAKQ